MKQAGEFKICHERFSVGVAARSSQHKRSHMKQNGAANGYIQKKYRLNRPPERVRLIFHMSAMSITPLLS
jgi:hypothetical protein